MGGDGGNDHGLFAWRTVIATAISVIIGIGGWTLKTTVNHSNDLADLKRTVTDLADDVRSYHSDTSAALGKLLDDDSKHFAANAQEEAEIGALQHERDVAPERHAEAFSPPPAIPAVPEIGTAITHAFPWLRARGTRHRVMHGGR